MESSLTMRTIVFYLSFLILPVLSMSQSEQPSIVLHPSAKEVVQGFLTEVRSGANPERAADYMADTVLAHQITSENPQTFTRTPANYTAHIREFLEMFGRFEFKITELLADGDKVYARWEQRGMHQADVEGYKATGLPLLEFTSAVYRVKNGKIVEYWLQSDRAGFDEQLKKNRNVTESAKQSGK